MISFAALSALGVVGLMVAAPAGPEEGCPSGRQVFDAMQVRFPTYLLMPDQVGAATSNRSDVLRSVLDVAPDGTVVRFALVDARGDTQLRRTLPGPGRGRPLTECLAMADTVAAIVERYLGLIAYEPGESGALTDLSPAPGIAGAPQRGGDVASRPRAAFLALGVGWRSSAGGQGEGGGLRLRLTGQLELTRSLPRLSGLLSLGAALGNNDHDLPDGRKAILRQFPVRIGAVLGLPAGPGWLEPAVHTGADIIVLSSTAGGNAGATSTVRFGPVVEAAVGYRLKIAGRFFVRPGIAIGFALKRYQTALRDQPGPLPLSTPWAYASFGIDAAVVFQ